MEYSKKEIEDLLLSYYKENAAGLSVSDEQYDVDFSRLKEKIQFQLLRTTEEFARSFETDIIENNTISGKMKKFSKRLIRKLTRFLTTPYADQMLRFQENNCQLIGDVFDYIEIKTQHYNEEQKQRLDDLTENYNESVKLLLDINHRLNDTKGELLTESYSQAGEDCIVKFILEYLNKGKHGLTYLDLGCNHFRNLSNTYSFYKKGMTGVLVDANPEFIELAKSNRPGDTSLNVGIGAEAGEELTFYVMNGDGLSSFNKKAIDAAIELTPWLKIEKEIKVPIVTVNEIFDKHFVGVPTLVSMDIEGDELAILNSIDMEKYRPLIYVIETIEYNPKLQFDSKRKDILDFMKANDYEEYAFTGINSIFIDKRAVDND